MLIEFTQLLQAHLKHGINRIAIFDIDLHHGKSIHWLDFNLFPDFETLQAMEPSL